MVPFPHGTGITPLTDIHLLFRTAINRSTLVTDPTTAGLDTGSCEVLVIEEPGNWYDLTRSWRDLCNSFHWLAPASVHTEI